MKKRLLFIVLSVFMGTAAAQDFTTLQGKTKTASGEAVPFVSIGIEKRSVGTSSNAEGAYTLKIPAAALKDNIRFSSVGYETAVYTYEELKKNGGKAVLKEAAMTLQEVAVTSRKMLKAEEIIKRCIKHLDDNYPAETYRMQVFYRERLSDDGKFTKLTEALLQIDDHAAYTDVTRENPEMETEVCLMRFSKDESYLKKNNNPIDLAFSQDHNWVRQRQALLDADMNKSFVYEEPILLSDAGGGTYKIKFAAAAAGMYSNLKGTAYINSDDWALVKLETAYKLDFATSNYQEGERFAYDVDQKIKETILFEKHANGRYYPSYQNKQADFYYMPSKESLKAIHSDAFFEQLTFGTGGEEGGCAEKNESFWEKYDFLPGTRLDEQAKEGLGGK